MPKPKRFMIVSIIDDGETVRKTVARHERIGDVWLPVFGQSDDVMSLPSDDAEQWMRDMAVWLLEGL